ncbi:hypothetical protein HanPI659440_Chr16g0623691 [Helianthus annuus]|nr:hypothetical protein HanPI659440_Chr16g0623691 [Helianthus annuus]
MTQQPFTALAALAGRVAPGYTLRRPRKTRNQALYKEGIGLQSIRSFLFILSQFLNIRSNARV